MPTLPKECNFSLSNQFLTSYVTSLGFLFNLYVILNLPFNKTFFGSASDHFDSSSQYHGSNHVSFYKITLHLVILQCCQFNDVSCSWHFLKLMDRVLVSLQYVIHCMKGELNFQIPAWICLLHFGPLRTQILILLSGIFSENSCSLWAFIQTGPRTVFAAHS